MKKLILNLINSKYFFVLTSLAWWLAFYPGFYSSDSFGALNQAKNGPITNIYTAAWPLTLRVLTIGGRVPGLATLACVATLSYAVKYFCQNALPKSSAKITSSLLLITPLVGAMGITLWHDIPMTAGLLITLSVVIHTSIFKERLRKSEYAHLFGGALLSSYRPNGLSTLLLFFVILLLVARSRNVLKYGSMAVLVALLFSVTTTFLVGQRSLVSQEYAQEWMRSDIACSWATNPTRISKDLQSQMERVAPLTQWDNPAGCTFLNRLGFSMDQVVRSTHLVPVIWFHIFEADPLRIVRIHGSRNGYLLPIPTTGAMHPPFINSIIEFPDRGISYVAPKVVAIFRPYVRVWNGLRPITAFAGLWLTVLVGIAIFSKRSRKSTLPALVMSLALEGILFAFAPIPDGRYALPVLIVGQAIAVGFALDFFFRKRGQKKI